MGHIQFVQIFGLDWQSVFVTVGSQAISELYVLPAAQLVLYIKQCSAAPCQGYIGGRPSFNIRGGQVSR